MGSLTEVNDNMKKLIKLMIVAVVITTVLVFTGCPTQNSDLDYPSYTSPFSVDLDVDMANTAAVTMDATATTVDYSTYNITIVGLVANIGDQYVIAGSSIDSDSTGSFGDHWVVDSESADDGLIFTVDDEGTLAITFYGKDPGYGDNSAEFQVAELDGSWAGLWNNGGNVCITNSAITGGAHYVIDVTIDPNEL
jgi:hypothetical protein